MRSIRRFQLLNSLLWKLPKLLGWIWGCQEEVGRGVLGRVKRTSPIGVLGVWWHRKTVEVFHRQNDSSGCRQEVANSQTWLLKDDLRHTDIIFVLKGFARDFGKAITTDRITLVLKKTHQRVKEGAIRFKKKESFLDWTRSIFRVQNTQDNRFKIP